jgi:hypothetical protein
MSQAPFWNWLLGALAVAALLSAIYPSLARLRVRLAAALTLALWFGWARLAFFHAEIWRSVTIAGPGSLGRKAATATSLGAPGHLAVPLWIEGEKLFAWACLLALAVLLLWRRRDDPLFAAGLGLAAALTLAALFVTNPFSAPLPGLHGELTQYFQAVGTLTNAARSGAVPPAAGSSQAAALASAAGVAASMAGRRTFFYNTAYMWVHPPALFVSYAAFAVAFLASVMLLATRAVRYERLSYDYAKFGFLVLTAGMLIGYPWALAAWKGESWWWSGKVNMSLMMWALYSGYLHSRLYLKRRGMWRLAGWLGVVCFATVVMTYATTYLVPGAHSLAGP